MGATEWHLPIWLLFSSDLKDRNVIKHDMTWCDTTCQSFIQSLTHFSFCPFTSLTSPTFLRFLGFFYLFIYWRKMINVRRTAQMTADRMEECTIRIFERLSERREKTPKEDTDRFGWTIRGRGRGFFFFGASIHQGPHLKWKGLPQEPIQAVAQMDSSFLPLPFL